MLKKTIVLALLGLFILPVDMLGGQKRKSRRVSGGNAWENQSVRQGNSFAPLAELGTEEESSEQRPQDDVIAVEATQGLQKSALAALGVASVAGCAALYKTYKNRKAVTDWVKRKIKKA